jgi:hypothetical protein
MTTITLPATPKPQGMAWRLVQPAQNNISTWTGSRQVLPSGRGWWECQITLPPIVGTSNFNAWRSFTAKMRGAANDVQIPVDPTAQSAIANTMSVNGAGQTGRTLNVDGLPNSTTVLNAGQFVTVGNQLLQLTADVTTNGSGQATLSFEPALRAAPADNATVEFKNPYCLMYLVEDPGYTVEPGYIYSLSLNLREAF